MMKHNKFIAALLAAAMLITVLPVMALASAAAHKAPDGDEFKVVVSMEGLTLGQGLYFEPKAYSLNEINSLLDEEDYGPFAQDELTAGMATLAFFIDNGIEYEKTGTWESSAYLSSVKDVDTGVLDIPEIITEKSGISNDDNSGNDDEYLGEFDYNSEAGWMITVNDYLINSSCAGWGLEEKKASQIDGYDLGNTYVVRWQFTIAGYGADLGCESSWGMPSYFEGTRRAPLYAAYAESTDAAKKAEALEVMERLTASQEEVDAALELLQAEEKPVPPEQAVNAEYSQILKDTLTQLPLTVTSPTFNTNGGEWTIIALARGGYFPKDHEYFNEYYSRIEQIVKDTSESIGKNGALHGTKSTENTRLILALAAIGRDPANVGGVDIINALSVNGMTWITKQGINGPIFALIALDAADYSIDDASIRQSCVDFILQKEIQGGGWALAGSNADPDITAMALQALINYKDDARVMEAAERAINKLSEIQRTDGGFASWGSVNAESIAQTIIALTAWGIDPENDSRFVKDGNSAVDALLKFYDASEKGFKHISTGSVNGMATDQASLALVAYDRFVNDRNALYDMSDVNSDVPVYPDDEMKASIALPEKVENKLGSSFNAVVSLNKFEEGFRLLDCIISVPNGLTVMGVTMGTRISGGEVSYNLEASSGKLRIVYFDAKDGSEIAAGGVDYPLELMTISFSLNDVLDAESISLAITGMTFKKTSDAGTQLVVESGDAHDTAALVNGLSFTAMTLYKGDGIDLIPETKTAIVIAVTGVREGARIMFDDGSCAFELKYNEAITKKTGISSYIAMISSDKPLEAFVKAENYNVKSGSTETLDFGDINGDGIINAQDALNAVNMWLRKAEEPTDDQLLAANVTGDGRVNTSDALGIVEYFVDGSEFAVISRASALKSTLQN